MLAFTALSTGVLLESCKPKDKKAAIDARAAGDGKVTIDRTPEEKAYDEKLRSGTFFTDHERATIAVFCDIIIPADEVSGSATEAKVPAFIEFMVQDQPVHQVPLRGGLHWVDLQMARRHGKSFKDCTREQQIALVDQIAYPEEAAPDMRPGVAFFSRLRNLTAAGFYTSEMGVRDLGYAGNRPNQWNGVPADVLKQYNLAYSEKEIKECVQYS
jgi:hypothetical protein